MCNVTQSSFVNNFRKGSVLIFKACCEAVSLTGWLKTAEICCFTVWRPEGCIQCLKGWFFPRENLIHAFRQLLGMTRTPRRPLACRRITRVSASIFTLLRSPCCLRLYTGPWIGAHTDDVILTWLKLPRPYFQIKSHAQVLGLRTSVSLLDGHNSAYNKWWKARGCLFIAKNCEILEMKRTVAAAGMNKTDGVSKQLKFYLSL